jgi:tRNA dimethylallyltransferase
MKNTKTKIIVILGQTSTGKSDFAVEIAKEIGGLNQSKRLVARTSRSEVLGEIISADSRQVYKGMDLGTGKITKKEMQGVPHYLLDVVSPSRVFSASNFKKQAEKKIKEIIKKNKIPIICGGTGFYIDTLTNNVTFPEVPPNKKLRVMLEKKTTEQLFEMLKKLDADRSKNIDAKNRVRLIRAIEIVKALGKVPSLSARQSLAESDYEVLKIGLTLPPDILKERIKNRLLTRIKKGMIKEVKDLHEQGLSWKRMNALGLEYRYTAMYLQNIISKEEMIEKIITETWHYAKRQNTWFKRDKDTIWIDPTKNKEKTFVIKEIKKFLK